MKFARMLLVVMAGWSVAAFVPTLGQEQEGSGNRTPEGLVLKTAETISFTTDEVTWASLDVSPDGRTILFEVLGDLYTLPIEGGQATRIVGDLSFESQPTYSPDGKTIAFLTDRPGVENLWIANADGSNPRAISKDTRTNDRPQIMLSPEWTPDGQYILVSKSRPPEPGTFGLFMYHRDGGTGVRIGPAPPPQPGPDAQGPPPPPPTNKMGAVVSPDGRFVYYAQRNGSFTYNAQFPLWQIYRHDRETGDASQITNARGSALRPVISPDGKWLVYGTRHKTQTGLRVRNLDTGAERWLAYPVTRDDQESRATRDTLPRYDFMPDGNSLVVPVAGKIQRIDFATGESRPIPFSVNVQAEVAPRVYTPVRMDDGQSVRARLIRWPTASPDGKRLVFSAMNRLYIMDLPSGTPRLLTSGTSSTGTAGTSTQGTPGTPGTSGTSALGEGEFMPTWSPDGQSIAYVTWTTTGGHIKRVAASGGASQTLTTAEGYYLDPTYTPDGSRIVFVRGAAADQLYSILLDTPGPDDEPDAPGEISGVNPPNTLELRSMPATGGDTTFIASSQGGRSPHFVRKDSKRVYMGGNRGLQSITMDGFDRRTHFRVTGIGPGNNPPTATEIRMSPDGTRAFVSLQDRHFLITVPMAGRETVDVRITGRGDNASVPVKRMSAEGGNYLQWAADGKTVTWGWGSQFFQQPVDANEPQKTEVVVELPRARAKGSVLLSGARIITMKGDEVLPSGDVLVTDNRIAGVGKRGSLKAPAGTRTISVTGKTIMPGLVDAHSHMWAPRGLHQTEVWQYLANLAYGVTTTRDPQTSTPDVFAYADMVDAGMMPGPRVYATGPGVFSGSGIDRSRGRLQLHQAVSRRLPHQHPQAVRRRRPCRPSMDHRGVQGVRHHGDHRGIARSEAEPDADGRRLLGSGTQPADHAALQGRRGIRRAHEDVLHTDHPRRVRRAVERKFLLRKRERGHGPKAEALGAMGAPRQHGAPTRAVVPAGRVRSHRHRERRRRHRSRRRQGGSGQPRPAAGTRRPLGDVEPAIRRPDPTRNAEDRDALRRRSHRNAAGRRLARGRQDGGLGRARSQPAGEHPQHELDSIRDEERRALRGRHPQHDLADAEDAAQAVLVGDGAEGPARPVTTSQQ